MPRTRYNGQKPIAPVAINTRPNHPRGVCGPTKTNMRSTRPKTTRSTRSHDAVLFGMTRVRLHLSCQQYPGALRVWRALHRAYLSLVRHERVINPRVWISSTELRQWNNHRGGESRVVRTDSQPGQRIAVGDTTAMGETGQRPGPAPWEFVQWRALDTRKQCEPSLAGRELATRASRVPATSPASQ